MFHVTGDQEGGMKTVRGLVLGALIGALVMTLVPAAGCAPAQQPDGGRVQPTIIPHFGGDDCTDPMVGSEATHSLLIPSPAELHRPGHRCGGQPEVNTSQRTITSLSSRRGGWHSTSWSRAERIRTTTTISLRRSGHRDLTRCCTPHRRGTGTTISATSPSVTTTATAGDLGHQVPRP